MIDKNDEALLQEAISLNNEGKSEDSLKILLGLELKYENKSLVNGLIANAYYSLEDYVNSAKYFLKTTLLNPKSEMASFCLFISLWNLGKYKNAYNELDRYLSSNQADMYKVTLEEFYEQLDEDTPKYQQRIIKKYYKQYFY